MKELTCSGRYPQECEFVEFAMHDFHYIHFFLSFRDPDLPPIVPPEHTISVVTTTSPDPLCHCASRLLYRAKVGDKVAHMFLFLPGKRGPLRSQKIYLER